MTPEAIKALANSIADATNDSVAQISADRARSPLPRDTRCQFESGRCRSLELALLEIVHLPDDADLHEAVLIALRAMP